MAVAAIVTLVTGSTAAMFSGPMLYVTIGLTALSVGVMGYYAWGLFSKYILGNSGSCCDTETEIPSCCQAKGKKSADFVLPPLSKQPLVEPSKIGPHLKIDLEPRQFKTPLFPSKKSFSRI